VSFGTCRKDLSARDDDAGEFEAELSDAEVEILSNYLMIGFIDGNYMRIPTLLKMNLSSRDFNTYSNANHLDKLMAMHDKARMDNETLESRYSWIKG
jgi:hypothetical protein